MKKILLLGSGELGKEFVISTKGDQALQRARAAAAKISVHVT